jgi:hypothetical protein
LKYILQEQPKEKEAPQVFGSTPWQAHVRLERNGGTEMWRESREERDERGKEGKRWGEGGERWRERREKDGEREERGKEGERWRERDGEVELRQSVDPGTQLKSGKETGDYLEMLERT